MMQVKAKELAAILSAEIVGNPDTIVEQLDKIEEATSRSLCFVANPKYEHYIQDSHAGIIIVAKDTPLANNNGTTFLQVDDPYASFTILLEKFASKIEQKSQIDEQARIAKTATIGKQVYIGAFAYIGEHVVIEDGVQIYPNTYIGDHSHIQKDSIIFPNVSIYHNTSIGQQCIIHAGVVIGSDGFGFAPQKDGTFKKIPQTGTVHIGHSVEIGANTVIDRATMGQTMIKDGVKMDNLVQIAHNVQIGENTVIASQAGISGSTKVGKNVMIGGQAGFVGHIQIADGVKINAQSGVSKSIKEKGTAVSGSPAENFRDHYKNIAYTRQLSSLMQRINDLEKELSKLKK